MASSYENDLRLNEMGTGDASGTWGTNTNTNLNLICDALGYGTENLGSDANTTITMQNGVADGFRSFYLKITSTTLTATREVTFAPNNVSKIWIVENATTGSQSITIKQGSGATVTIANGDVKMIYTDGAGSGAAVFDALAFKELDVSGTLNLDSDSSGIKFGADKEITVSHVADVGLNLKNTNTGDDKPFILKLQTAEAVITASEFLGKIQFQAPDTTITDDARLVAAQIAAYAESDFATDANATKLSFATGASEAAVEKMSLSSTGVLTLNGSSGSLVIPDDGNIGSASDTDAIAISSGGDVTMSQDLAVTGTATFNGNVTLGNAASDNITVGGDFVSHLTPNADSTYDLGGTSLYWRNLYADSMYTTGRVFFGTSSTIGVNHGAHLLFAGAGSEYGYGARAVSSSGSYFFSIMSSSGVHEGGLYMLSGTISVQNVSDYRLKQNISALTGAIDKVKALNPVRFKRNDHENAVMQDGFLAHEVQAVVPEAVVGEKDAVKEDGSIDPQSMDAALLIPVLTSALKEAIAKIETLEQKVAALEAK